MQIEEIRSQLKINVSVASGSPPAPAPIESFEDMVNSLKKKKKFSNFFLKLLYLVMFYLFFW
jgi:uncharacterized protein YfkK (UPF0435 family)